MLTPISLGAHKIDHPVFLAPMAGITDAPFRAQARRFGLGMAVSEMVESAALLSGKSDVRAKARLDPAGEVAVIQIAGRKPEFVAEAARIAEAAGAVAVDLNMGCPAKKVTSGMAGAALMREPDLAKRLVEAAAEAVGAPVTVKMRLGWAEGALDAPALARGLEDAGAQLFTIHGRTRAQGYKGAANWRAVGAVTAAVRAPVIVNGDISDEASARGALRASGAAGVMIGRGAQGRPWVPGCVLAALSGAAPLAEPAPAARVRLAAEFYEALLLLHGAAVGVRAARKHLTWRLAETPGGMRVRDTIIRETEPPRVLAALEEFARRLEDTEAPDAAPPAEMAA